MNQHVSKTSASFYKMDLHGSNHFKMAPLHKMCYDNLRQSSINHDQPVHQFLLGFVLFFLLLLVLLLVCIVLDNLAWATWPETLAWASIIFLIIHDHPPMLSKIAGLYKMHTFIHIPCRCLQNGILSMLFVFASVRVTVLQSWARCKQAIHNSKPPVLRLALEFLIFATACRVLSIGCVQSHSVVHFTIQHPSQSSIHEACPLDPMGLIYFLLLILSFARIVLNQVFEAKRIHYRMGKTKKISTEWTD